MKGRTSIEEIAHLLEKSEIRSELISLCSSKVYKRLYSISISSLSILLLLVLFALVASL